MNFLKTILLIAFLFHISGCASNSSSSQALPEITIEISDSDRIRFQGKGAGAGMMLMSSMGPMGVAVGIAIDEGIAKQINETAQSINFDIHEMLLDEIKMQLSLNPEIKSIKSPIKIILERYGFISWSSDQDVVATEIRLTWLNSEGAEKTISYPQDFQQEQVRLAPLEKVKVDAALIQSLLDNAIEVVVREMIESI